MSVYTGNISTSNVFISSTPSIVSIQDFWRDYAKFRTAGAAANAAPVDFLTAAVRELADAVVGLERELEGVR